MIEKETGGAMAMTKCRECGKDLSDQAPACPHCGAPAAKAIPPPPLLQRHFSLGRLVLWVVAAFVLYSCTRAMISPSTEGAPDEAVGAPESAPAEPTASERAAWVEALGNESLPAWIRLDRANQLTTRLPSSPEAAAAKAKIPELEALVAKEWIKEVDDKSLPPSVRLDRANQLATTLTSTPEAAAAKAKIPELQALVADEKTWGSWTYSTTEDSMTGKRTHVAVLQSNNTVEFDFPYQGSQHGQLMLRTHPRHGKDVVLSIEKGQLLCRSYDGCTVLVRFDEGEPQRWSAMGASDNSSTSIFLESYDRFVRQMQKAKLVRIAAEVHEEGAPVFEFNVHGFQAAKYKPK
jgi:hypothetical protein